MSRTALMATLFALPPMDSTLGCFFLSGILSTALWGMGCIQLHYYYENSSQFDKKWLRYYIFLIWLLDTGHQGLWTGTLYMYFVTHYGNLIYLFRLQRPVTLIALVSAIIDAMVQFVFVKRVWSFSNKNRVLGGALVAAILGQLIATLVYFAQIVHFTRTRQLRTVLGTERVMNAFCLVTDTSIAATLVYLCYKRRAGTQRTDSVLQRLIIYAVSTGLGTSILSLVALIGLEASPTSLIYIIADIVVPKLYLNSLLASLNARCGLRERLEANTGCSSIHFGTNLSGNMAHEVRSDIQLTPIERQSGTRSEPRTEGQETVVEDKSDTLEMNLANGGTGHRGRL